MTVASFDLILNQMPEELPEIQEETVLVEEESAAAAEQ